MKRVRLSTPDLTARRVIMCSLAYYGFDMPLVSDQQFDQWCSIVASRFDELDRFRQWQLGSADEVSTTAYHVKVTHASFGGTLSWFDHKGVVLGKIVHTSPWKWSKRHKVEYLTPSDFVIQKRKRVRL